MLTKEVDMLVIRRRLQGVDFNGVRGPVLEKQPERFLGKVSRCQSFHELRTADPLLPALGDLALDSVDVCFGLIAIALEVHRLFLIMWLVQNFNLTSTSRFAHSFTNV